MSEPELHPGSAQPVLLTDGQNHNRCWIHCACLERAPLYPAESAQQPAFLLKQSVSEVQAYFGQCSGRTAKSRSFHAEYLWRAAEKESAEGMFVSVIRKVHPSTCT